MTADMVPRALTKLHRRLMNKTELYKLHIKHYHMTPTQFRRRTSELALPEHVYRLYEQVCLECPECLRVSKPLARAKISGLRAEKLGDLIFVDHCELKLPQGQKFIVLLVLDGATSLLGPMLSVTFRQPRLRNS